MAGRSKRFVNTAGTASLLQQIQCFPIEARDVGDPPRIHAGAAVVGSAVSLRQAGGVFDEVDLRGKPDLQGISSPAENTESR